MQEYLRGRILHCTDTPDKEMNGIEYFQDGVLVLQDDKIIDLLPATAAFQQGLIEDSCIDLGHKLLVPGFIDTHVHAYQLDIIASYGEKLLQWLDRYTFPTEALMANNDLAEEVANTFLQTLLRNGTTSALAFSTVHESATDTLFKAASALNMCFITGKVMMDRHAPDSLLQEAQACYLSCKGLIEKWHNTQRLKYAVTPRFAITSTDAQLALAGQLLKDYQGLYLQTHLSENKDEIQAVKELFPQAKNYLDVYDQHGLCTEKSVFAHCVFLEPEETSRLAESGSVISSCPSSNMFLGSGLLNWDQMKNTGQRLSLGTDVGGGTSFSMLRTLGDAYKMAQLTDSSLSPLESFYTITLGNARSLNLENKIGNLVPGSDADFVILDPDIDSLISRRVKSCQSIAEEWFIYSTLGDHHLISETWVAGKTVHIQNPQHSTHSTHSTLSTKDI